MIGYRIWVLLIGLAASCISCTSICPKTWETATEISHSVYFGQGLSQTISIGGDIGSECREDKSK